MKKRFIIKLKSYISSISLGVGGEIDAAKKRNIYKLTYGRVLALVGLFTCSSILPSYAATWSGSGGDNDWFDSENWDTSEVPSDITDVYVNNGTLNIFGGKAFSNSAHLGHSRNSISIVNVSGMESQWDILKDLYVGTSSSGKTQLNITEGGLVSVNYGSIGYFSGSLGAVTIDGAGSMWKSATHISVGGNGTGELIVRNEGSVIANNGYIGGTEGHGTVTVEGVNTSWKNSNDLIVGYTGEGVLSIKDGGYVYSVDTKIGYSIYSNDSRPVGTINVDGVNSLFESEFLTIGSDGKGALNITNGSTVKNGNSARIGSTNGVGEGTVEIQDANSKWIISASLSLANGTLNISDGAAVSSDRGFVGYDSNGNSVATVSGKDAVWEIAKDMNVGYNGKGELNIINGGKVVAKTTTSSSIGYYSSSSNATVTVSGINSRLEHANGMLDIGSLGSVKVDVLDGGVIIARSTRIGCYTLNSSGTVTVDGVGSKLQNTYDMVVGRDGSGTLNITNGGSVTNTNGYVGYASNSKGIVNVSGVNATWQNSGSLFIAVNEGTLNITNGGSVLNGNSYVGRSSGATGVVNVDGADSTWDNNFYIYLGSTDGGIGILNISDDGLVKAQYIIMEDKGIINIGSAANQKATSGGFINSSSGIGGGGILQFNHTATKLDPYYFNSGFYLNGDTPVGSFGRMGGDVQIVHTAGTTVLAGTYSHRGGTIINGGNLILAENAIIEWDKKLDPQGTVINGGTLILSQSSTLNGDVTINSGGTLSGLGNATGNVVVNEGGVILVESGFSGFAFRAASTVGLSIDSLTLNEGSILNFDGGQLILKALTLNAESAILVNLAKYENEGVFTLMTFESLVGFDSNITVDTDANLLFTLDNTSAYEGTFEFHNDSGVYSLVFNAMSSVPEPSDAGFVLGTFVLGGTLLCRRVRRKK